MKAFTLVLGDADPKLVQGLEIVGSRGLRLQVMVGTNHIGLDPWRTPVTSGGRVYDVHPAVRDGKDIVLAAPPPPAQSDMRIVILLEGIPVRDDCSLAFSGAGFESLAEEVWHVGGSAMLIMEPNSVITVSDGSRQGDIGIESTLLCVAYSFAGELQVFPDGNIQDATKFLGGGWPLRYL